MVTDHPCFANSSIGHGDPQLESSPWAAASSPTSTGASFPSKLFRSVSSKLRALACRDAFVPGDMRCLPGAPFHPHHKPASDSWHFMRCFGINARQSGPEPEEREILDGIRLRMGISSVTDRLHRNEATAVARLQEISDTQASLQHCGCFTAIGSDLECRNIERGDGTSSEEDGPTKGQIIMLNDARDRHPHHGRPTETQQGGYSADDKDERGKISVSCLIGQKLNCKQQRGHSNLPDDVVEMCLARLPFDTLARTRGVCRKWRALTMSPHFLLNRENLPSRKPWLLLLGISRDANSTAQIHALDTSSDQWYSIQADMLSGRSLFSVASLNGLVYVVGGCSNLSDGSQRTSKKTHKSMLVYNLFTYAWSKRCSMQFARAMAVTAACKCMGKTCAGSQRGEKLATRDGLIVVGGKGLWNQPLFTAEIYDTATDTWREIAKLPADHGVICAGVVCNGVFYAYSETDKLAAYNFDLNVWTSIQVSSGLTRLHEYIPKLLSCQSGKLILSAVAWGSRERAASNGSSISEAATRMLWEFCPKLQTWQQLARHPDAPLDWNAAFVCEGNHIYGAEMFKIFGQVLGFVTVCDVSSSEVSWRRMSRMRLRNDVDVSSCITKAAVVVNL